MKLLFAIKSMDHAVGGAERVLADITDGLAQRGHDITVLTFDTPGGQPFYALNSDIKRITLGIGDTGKKSNLKDTVRRMKALRYAVKAQKPDAVIAFMHSMFIPTAFALIGTGVPVVASEHIVPAHYKTRKFEFTLLLLSSLFIKKMTVLSEAVKHSYPRFLWPKIYPIANPVALPETIEKKKRAQKTILNVGRLSEQKDQKTLIEAFALLAKDYPDWIVKIIGEGKLRPALEALIDQHGLGSRILLPGTTQNIAEEYAQADIFALPSLYESFGLATAEAMAFGLPVIGFTDCPGTNELITDQKDGVLVSGKGRAESFKQGLEVLMRSADLRETYGTAGRNTIKRYSPDKIVTVWERFLSDL